MGSKFLENYERRLVESGIEKEKIRIVQELKKDNIPTNKIQKYTGLSLSMINMI